MRTSNYNFDIDKHSLIKPVVIIRSGDHDIDTIKITLSNQGDPVDLTNATVKFMGTTPAGNKIIDDVHSKIVDAASGIFEYTFPSAAGSSVGEYEDAYFSIILGNGQTSTMNFRIQVLSGVDISAPVASEYISHYDTMVTELNSAYDSATKATNQKMASTVSSLANSAATVLDSALARVNNVNSTANTASSAASNAVSMASSVATTVTSQASYINSVASSAASNVSSVAATVVDKLNNIKVGGRNLYLNSKSDLMPKGFGINVAQTATIEHFDSTTDMLHIVSAQGNGTSVGIYIFDYGNGKIPNNSDWSYSADIKGIGKIAKFGIEDSSISTTKGVVGNNWSRVSQTGHVNEPQYKSIVMYFDTTNSPLDVYIKLPKLEVGNIPTDWTPAPEDLSPKLDIGGRNYLRNSSGDTLSGWESDVNLWSIANNTARGNVFTATPTTTWTGGGTNSLAQTVDTKIIGKQVTVSFWAKSVVNGAKFHSEPQGGANEFNTSLTADWVRYSYTIANFTGRIYFMAVEAGKTYYIDDIKLELGNIATDWSPSLEDVDNSYVKKSGDTMTGGLTGGQTILPDSGDLNALTDTGKYYQTKTVNAVNWKNRPANAPNFAFSVDVIGNGNASLGTQVYYVHTTNRMWVRTIWLDGSMNASPWAELANNSNVVHKTGNETVAGDKTLTGNTTLSNIKSSNVKTGSVKLGGLTINFRETAVGVNVYMDGSWQGSFSMGDAYVDSASIPTSISNPRQNVVLNIVGNAGVGGVTTNSPFKLEVLITTDGKVKYRSKNLRDNDTAARTATIVGAASTFYALD